MKKVLIISPCGLPIPAVKGGAVLTLIESIIRQNEIEKKIQLTVVGAYDREAEEKSWMYPETEFLFVHENCVTKMLDKSIEFFLRVAKRNKENPRRFFWKLYVISYLQKLLVRDEYDAIVFENAGYLLRTLDNDRVCKKYNGRLFYHLHNEVPISVTPKALRKCRVLMISNYLQKGINALCEAEMNEHCKVLRNGFDTNLFARQLNREEIIELRKKLGIDSQKKIVIYTGRLNSNKGVDKLAEAFSNLNKDDLVLLIVGSPNFGANTKSEFSERLRISFQNLKESIVFTGYVPYDEMWKYYGIANLGVFPSMWEEPAGLTMLEAIASQIPVITTISGGIQEYLPKDYAYYIERDEHIVENIEHAICDVLNNYDSWKLKAIEGADYIKKLYTEENFYLGFIANFV